MSSRAKFKPPPVGRNPYYDAEVMDDDDERWACNPSGDLGWEYTARTLGRLSTDALVGYLVNNAFTVPARDYNPSAPFVHIKFAASQGWDVEGEAAVTTVSLPHGYRLPLMFVHKYMWATILRTLPSEEEWQEARGQMVHLCRLCENLFRRAHAKALQGGMEKGWRCIMFDRLLCRFYKHWDKSNPNAVLGFAKTHGMKEYDRDVLKHDWKRWCLRGLNGVKMIESEVIDGITLEKNIGTLARSRTTGRWELNGALLMHVTTKPDPDYMTEFSSLSSLSSDGEREEEERTDDEDSELMACLRGMFGPTFRKRKAQREEEEEEEEIVSLDTAQPSNGTGSGTKRPHDFPAVDQDELERQQKRSRIEESLASSNVGSSVGGGSAEMGGDTSMPSHAGISNSNPDPNTDLYSTSTIPHVNPGSTSPFPVLSPTEPWTPLPPSVYQVYLNPHVLPQLTNAKGADAEASSSQAPVASGSRSVAKSGIDASQTASTSVVPTEPAPGLANKTQIAAPETRTRSAQADKSYKQKQPQSQPLPAWKVLDSMVPPRGSRSQAGTSASAAKKIAKATEKGKGKEKEKKTKTVKVKVQREKGKEKEKLTEAPSVDLSEEWGRDAAKVWPKKPPFGPYGEQLNGWHRAAVSSSTILAAAGTAPEPSMRVPRRMTDSGRVLRPSTSAARVINVPGTDSEPELDDDDIVESGNSPYSPPRHNTKTQSSLSAPVRGRHPADRDDDDVREIPAHLVQAKALELLVSLVTDSRTGTSGNPALAASVAALAANANVNIKGNNGGTAVNPPPAAAADASSGNAVASSSKSTSQSAIAKPTPIPSWEVHQVFRNTTAPIPGRLSPLSAAAVSQFSNQCTQECAAFDNEGGRRLPHPHNTMYPPIGHRGGPWKVGAPYDLLPRAYLRYERKLRNLLEEHGEGAAVGVDGSTRNGTGLLDRYQAQFQSMDLDEDAESDASSEKDMVMGKDGEEVVNNVALRLEDFEERFAEVKAELVTIVERLMILENKDTERAARELLGEETQAKAKPAGIEAKGKQGEVEVETQKENKRDVEKERGPPGGVEDMYVDDPAPDESVSTTGGVDTDIQIDLSSGETSSQTTQPAMSSNVSAQDTSLSSTLVEKSQSSSPPPNPHMSSTESIASSSGNSPNLIGDMQQGADHHSVSEVDGSELTTVNAPGKDDVSIDRHAPVLTSSISRLVEELVHAKMLSVMEEMAQNKLKDATLSANEPKAMETLTAPSSPSLAPQLLPQEPTAEVRMLIAELRSLKAEFKEREQKDKEEKLAMRELHSAEVDALRRRLSYLENRDPGPMAMAMHMSHRYYPPPFIPGDHGSPSEHYSHRLSAPPGGEYFDAERTRRQGFILDGGYGRDVPDTSGGGSANDAHTQDRERPSASSATPTPGPSEKSKPAQQPPGVETPPLPIKSQRKQHIMFPRARLP